VTHPIVDEKLDNEDDHNLYRDSNECCLVFIHFYFV
jgi:hypothetical protein